MVCIHVEVSESGDQVMKKGPNESKDHQFNEPSRQKANAHDKSGAEFSEGDLGGDRCVKEPNDKRQQQKHDGATDPVQNGDPTRRWQSVGGEVFECVDVSKLRALLFYYFCHKASFFLSRSNGLKQNSKFYCNAIEIFGRPSGTLKLRLLRIILNTKY
jgi:hypothetical protein